MRVIFAFAILTVLMTMGGPGARSSVALQAPAPASVQVTAARIEGSALIASLRVADRSGNAISDISASNVTATIDGQPVRLSSLTPGVDATLPLALVLAIDTSGSMLGAPIAAAKQAIRPILQSLQPGDRAALVDFASLVAIGVPLTSDTAALTRGLDALVAAGNTALYSAVAQSAALAAAAPEPRKAVVLLSDGENFGPATTVTRAQAIAAVQAAGVPFFVVGLGNQTDADFLQAISTAANGQLFSSASAADLTTLYATVSDRLRKQYTARVEIPPSLASGTHRVAFVVGAGRGEIDFAWVAAPVLTKSALTPLTGALREPTVVRLVPAPANPVFFTIDEKDVPAESDGVGVRIDPLRYDPAKPHTLVASYDSATGRQSETLSFKVAALPPRITAPLELTGLGPGDTVRLTIEAQPGSLTASYLVDGRELGRDEQEPFEFTIPSAGILGAGDHTLAIVVQSPGGTDSHEFPFVATAPGKSNTGAYIVLALSALGVLAVLAYATRIGLRRLGARQPVADGAALAGQLDSLAAGRAVAPAQAPVAAPSASDRAGRVPWGTLKVVEGRVPGAVFSLHDERELVGRAKFCSVRLDDRSVAEAHFVIGRGGEMVASLPGLTVEVNGIAVRRAQLASGDTLRVGQTTLTVTLAA